MIYEKKGFQKAFKVIYEVNEYRNVELNHDSDLFRQNLISQTGEMNAQYGPTEGER